MRSKLAEIKSVSRNLWTTMDSIFVLENAVLLMPDQKLGFQSSDFRSRINRPQRLTHSRTPLTSPQQNHLRVGISASRKPRRVQISHCERFDKSHRHNGLQK